MALSGLHLLLTYRCTRECDHCFVWGSPQASGAMSLEQVRQLMAEGEKLGTVRWVYFEGGEPFLFYPILLRGVELATTSGFGAGIVSNGYWATSAEDARSWLEPLARAGLSDLSLSTDVFHGEGIEAHQVGNAVVAARALGIPTSTLTLATPPGARPAKRGPGLLPGTGGGPAHPGGSCPSLGELRPLPPRRAGPPPSRPHRPPGLRPPLSGADPGQCLGDASEPADGQLPTPSPSCGGAFAGRGPGPVDSGS